MGDDFEFDAEEYSKQLEYHQRLSGAEAAR